tara:strand:- start:481 stop:3243 length:2763 start_codon:yes stop_codon:yes gene_type:complete
MKKHYYLFKFFLVSILIISCNSATEKQETESLNAPKKVKKTMDEKADASRERLLHDFNMQKNPYTGIIPKTEKNNELENALIEKQNNSSSKVATNTYISRGPSNLGGRTRSLKVDISDPTGNTILSGGVSSGVFRSTNGGANWTKVSPFDEIHNVTSIAQDPRVGFQNIWYYGTGEFSGNSASVQESFYGNGVWKSTDSGLTWQQIPVTANGSFQVLDNFFDFIIDMEVHPLTGELFVASAGKLFRLTNTGTVDTEFEIDDNGFGWTDLEITSTGRVYFAIDGRESANKNGIWTSVNGLDFWERISTNSSPADWDSKGRITMAIAPSNENIIYALYNNGVNNSNSNRAPEADLWQYNALTKVWTDFSSKLPDETGGDSDGNDPFSIQGGYDLVISVKPDNENYLVIGGTNIYKISNITTGTMFQRIGGYISPASYGIYNQGGVKHHPDIHAIEWDPSDFKVLYSGTDGGVHRTSNINAFFITWENLNNNYLTYQYYHVNMVNEAGNDFIIGGAQDNGTTIGGLNSGQVDKSFMGDYFGGDGAAVAISKSALPPISYTVYASTQNGRILRGNQTQLTADIRPVKDYDNNDDPNYYDSRFVTYFYMDPVNTSTIYYASLSKLLRTNDAENVDNDTWELVGNLPFSEQINTIEASSGVYNPNTSYLLIGGNGGNVFRLKDPKNAMDLNNVKKITPSDIPVSNGNEGQYTSDISVHPTNPDIAMVVYASYGSSIKNIFITKNATANTPTWVEVERNLNAHSVRSAAIAVVNNQINYFVGTARGLYKSTNPETTDWSLEGGSVMGIPIVSGLVYRSSDNILLVGTHGNGMYETNLNSALSIETNNIDGVKMAMYPNPAQFELRFATNDFDLNDITKFSIYDINGKQVKKGNLNNKSIDVSTLSKGIYIVNLKHNNISTSRKFVKN